MFIGIFYWWLMGTKIDYGLGGTLADVGAVAAGKTLVLDIGY